MNAPASINSKRLIAINTAVKYAAITVVNLVSFFLTPYLIRALGPLLLGLKTLAYQALQFVGLAHTSMGISTERYAKLNFARGDYEELNSTLSAGFVVSAVSAALFAAGSVVLAVYARPLFGLPEAILPTARAVFLLIGFGTAFLILTGVWETPVFVTERFYLADLGQLICTVLPAVAVVVAFEYGRPSIVLWVLLSSGALVAWRLLVMMPLARRLLPSFRLSLARIKSSRQVRELMAFGGLNFFGGIGYLLYYTSDSIIISNLAELGPEKIVYYGVAQRWDPQLKVFVMAFVGSMLPVMTAMVSLNQPDRLRAAFLRGTRYSVLIGAFPALALMIFAVPFLTHWVGADFARESAVVMQLIMAQSFLSLPERMANQVNIAYGRMGGPVVVSLLCGILNIVLSIALVKYAGMGLTGVAAGSVIALLIVAVYGVAFALRLLRLPAGTWFREGCLPAAGCTLPMIGAAWAVRALWPPAGLFQVFVQIGWCGVVYLAGAWFLGLRADERRQALGALRRALGRAGPGAAP